MVYRDFDDETLEREYTPASRVSDIQIYLESYRQRGESARIISKHSKLPYGDHPDEWLWYSPHTDLKKRSLIIFVHGGFWRRLSADDGTFLTPNWQRLGYSVASVNYSLCPNETLDVLVSQVSRAIKFLGSLHDPIKTILVGHSAGAQLAAMAVCEPLCPMFMGAIFVSGVFDLEPILHTSINNDVKLDSETARRLSPIHHIALAKNTPLALIWGENETDEFKRQSVEFARLWSESELRNAAKNHEIKERNHFDILDELAELSVLSLIK